MRNNKKNQLDGYPVSVSYNKDGSVITNITTPTNNTTLTFVSTEEAIEYFATIISFQNKHIDRLIKSNQESDPLAMHMKKMREEKSK